MITTILIIALVSTLAINLIDSSYTQFRKTRLHTETEQLQYIARAVEEFGIQVLYWDNWFDALIWHQDKIDYDLPRPSLEDKNPLGYDPHNDSLFETWSAPQTPEFLRADLDDEYALLDVLYITDLNRYFNINNLHFSNSLNVKQAFDANVKIFKELLRQILDKDVNPDKFANEIIDWLDHDNDSRSAILLTEDDVYRRAGSVFRPANRPINSIGELSHVLGMTPDIMSKLSEFVVSLPVYVANFAPDQLAFSPYHRIGQDYPNQSSPALTKININTCAPELLSAVFSLYNNKSGLDIALEKQGYFQNINKPQALDLRAVISADFNRRLDLTQDKPHRKYTFNQLEHSSNLVASEYSDFFLIESFFQKNNGIVFNHESLVYKNKMQFNHLPVVIQRQFDWLPLHSLASVSSDESL